MVFMVHGCEWFDDPSILFSSVCCFAIGQTDWAAARGRSRVQAWLRLKCSALPTAMEPEARTALACLISLSSTRSRSFSDAPSIDLYSVQVWAVQCATTVFPSVVIVTHGRFIYPSLSASSQARRSRAEWTTCSINEPAPPMNLPTSDRPIARVTLRLKVGCEASISLESNFWNLLVLNVLNAIGAVSIGL